MEDFVLVSHRQSSTMEKTINLMDTSRAFIRCDTKSRSLYYVLMIVIVFFIDQAISNYAIHNMMSTTFCCFSLM